MLVSPTTFSSKSVTTTAKVGQALESPRYTQRSSQSTPETQVDATPMLVICTKETVGVKDGVALGAAEGGTEGVLLGVDDGVPLGAADGSAEGVLLGEDDGAALGAADGVALGAEDGAKDGTEDGVALGDDDGALEGHALGDAEGSADGIEDGAAEGVALGDDEGKGDGAGVYDTWKSIESVTVTSPVHVIVIVYSLTSASPEVTCICWPSLTVVVEPMTFPSRSATTTSSIVQALESPR